MQQFSGMGGRQQFSAPAPPRIGNQVPQRGVSMSAYEMGLSMRMGNNGGMGMGAPQPMSNIGPPRPQSAVTLLQMQMQAQNRGAEGWRGELSVPIMNRVAMAETSPMQPMQQLQAMQLQPMQAMQLAANGISRPHGGANSAYGMDSAGMATWPSGRVPQRVREELVHLVARIPGLKVGASFVHYRGGQLTSYTSSRRVLGPP